MRKRIVLLLGALVGSILCSHAEEAKLRQGDTLELRFRGIPDGEQASLNGGYRIGDKGMIKLPYLKPFKLAGLTPSQGQRAIEQQYVKSQVFSDPAVTIIVDPIKAARTVTVLGEVAAPGAVPYSDGLSVIAAIGLAKGFSDFADPKHVLLTREGKSQRLDLSRAANPNARLKLLPGDVVSVQPDRRPFR